MKELLSQSPEEILSAGLHPTFDMLETYAYHLPNASLASALSACWITRKRIMLTNFPIDTKLFYLICFAGQPSGHLHFPLDGR